MISLALFALAHSQCTNDEVAAIMENYGDGDAEGSGDTLLNCLVGLKSDDDNPNNCIPQQEEEGGGGGRRRKDENNFDEMPEAGMIYSTFSCYCSDCMSHVKAQGNLCSSCP